MQSMMTVGQISKLFNITPETLRHYDRIGLLKPIINEENGYRYYSIKEMEKLDLILDAKYLEIPLSDIKEAISNESVENYIELIVLQENIIDKKIKHLLKIKEQAKEKKKILKEMMNFENLYNLENLDIVYEENTIIYIPIEMVIQGKIKQIDSSQKSLYLERWMIIYKAKDNNTLIEDETYIGVNKKDLSNLVLPKSKKIIEQNYKGKMIKIKFVGIVEEIEDYIKSILSYFYKEDDSYDIDISLSFIWSVNNENSSINFLEINIPLKI